MDISFKSNFLPVNADILLDTNYRGEICFSLEDRRLPSFSFFAQNRASSALNEILNGLNASKIFRFDNESKFASEKISDVAYAIFERYETRYRASYWQSIVDTFKACLCIETDLQKMKNLLNLILRHPQVKFYKMLKKPEEEFNF
ncbi:MAG: hypothetical protein H0T62_04995 [Parachlamydiaceae bacterium]|nr:hypothetical protein [Parachlamydiaceae bacterium]